MALIDVLRELAMQGKTIITSIHQPSSQIFQSFDQLILLADGKTIYMVIYYLTFFSFSLVLFFKGKPSNALSYFATLGHYSSAQYNPADYVMDLVNQDMNIREQLKEAYLQNRITTNQQVTSIELSQQYLIPEPSGNESDLTNPDNINLIPNKDESKWPIGFLPTIVDSLFTQFSINWKKSIYFAQYRSSISSGCYYWSVLVTNGVYRRYNTRSIIIHVFYHDLLAISYIIGGFIILSL